MMMRVMAHRHAESTAQSHTHARSLVVRSALVVSAVLNIWRWRCSYLALACLVFGVGVGANCDRHSCEVQLEDWFAN